MASVERFGAMAVQLKRYNNPADNTAYGEGPMQDALIKLRINTALKHFKTADGPILDVGFGKGEVLEALHRAGKEAVGIDLAPRRVIDTASKIAGPIFMCGAADEIPLADNTISGATAYEVFEHLSPDAGIIMARELYRVLLPGSTLILSTPNPDHLSVRRFLGLPPIKEDREDHFNEVNQNTLADIFTSAGFKDIKIHGIGLIPGMWYMQDLIPSKIIHEMNVKMGYHFPSAASETLMTAKK